VRRRALTALLLCCITVRAATAEATRFGEVTVGPYDPDGLWQTLFLNGERIASLGDFRPSSATILQIFGWGSKGDAILIRTWSGGIHCCEAYHFLRLDGQGVHLSAEFGTFGRDPSDFEVLPDVIRFRLERDYPADIDHQMVSYDGIAGAVADVMEDDTGVVAAKAGSDVTRWVGVQTGDLFDDPRERVRFRQIMNQEDLNEFRTDVGNLGTYDAIQDGYLLAWGCRQSFCNVNFGFVGVEVATGQPFAVWFVEGKRRDFLLEGSDLPEPLVAMIAEQLARQ
jgi:hypothetical protein